MRKRTYRPKTQRPKTGSWYGQCTKCERRAVWSSRLKRWLHVRPDPLWHAAVVLKVRAKA
jgi:hypothetical protein